MAIVQRALTGRTARRNAWRSGVCAPAAVAARAVSALVRLAAGSGSGYRSYPRERFSDFELHQLVAGRKDRLDGQP